MISLSYDDTLSRVRINADNINLGAQTARVERSTTGVQWVTVRGGAARDVINGELLIIDDYEFKPDVVNMYRVTPNVSFVEDTFTRTETGEWGTADSGHTYSITANKSGATYAVDGKGTVELGADDLATRAAIQLDGSAIQADEFDAVVTVSASAIATGEALVARILGRFVNPSNFYTCNTAFQHDGNVYIELDIVEGGIGNHFIPPISKGTYAADDAFTMRFQAIGNELKVKLWPAGNPEPETWDMEVTDDTFPNAGGIGIRTDRLTGNTNTDPVISYDNLAVSYTPIEATDVQQGNITPNLDGIWLKSIARPFLNRKVKVRSFSDIERQARNGVFQVVGRTLPIAVTDVRSGRTVDIEVELKKGNVNDFDFVLASGDPVLLHVPAGHDLPTMYAVVGEARRGSLWGHKSNRRVFTLPLTEVAAPHPDLVGVTVTYGSLTVAYSSYGDLLADNDTYFDVLERIGNASEVIVE